MEQLQLEVEEQLFNQDEGSLVQMIEILGIEADVVGKTKMHKIKIIRKEIDSKLQSDEKQIYMWSQRNRLSIHNGKSEAMLLSTKPLIGPLQELRYEENRIDFVNSTCCLGIEIDNKLSWSPHIDKLCKSYRKKLGALRRMPRLPPKVLEEIYFKTVVSGVSYCIPVWGGCTAPLFDRLEEIHTKAARLIHDLPRDRDNLGETYVLACKMLTSGCRPWLFAYMKGTVPPLEPKGESTKEAKQNAGATGIKNEKKSAEGKMKKEQAEKGRAEHILSQLEKTKAIPS